MIVAGIYSHNVDNIYVAKMYCGTLLSLIYGKVSAVSETDEEIGKLVNSSVCQRYTIFQRNKICKNL